MYLAKRLKRRAENVVFQGFQKSFPCVLAVIYAVRRRLVAERRRIRALV